MINSLYISNLVNDNLLTDNELNQYINGRVYALIADFGALFPYVSFSIENIVPNYSKDGGSYDTARVNIVCAAKTYDEVVGMAQRVRSIFECKVLDNELIKIGYISIDSISEFYDDAAQCFAKRLVLNIGRIINK